MISHPGQGQFMQTIFGEFVLELQNNAISPGAAENAMSMPSLEYKLGIGAGAATRHHPQIIRNLRVSAPSVVLANLTKNVGDTGE